MDQVIVSCDTGEAETVPLADAELAAQAESAQAGAAAEQTRLTEEANAVTLRDRALQALDTNRTFLALTSPTNAQTLAQVRALTRQNNGIIRLLLHRLDATD